MSSALRKCGKEQKPYTKTQKKRKKNFFVFCKLATAKRTPLYMY